MLISVKHVGVALALLGSATAAAQEKVVLGGAGSMIPIAQELVKAFVAKNPGVPIQVNARTMGSTGGIKSLESGSVSMALAARTLKPEETAGNVMHYLGRAPVVFAVHKDVPVAGLRQAQVCELYEGKHKSWRTLGGGDVKVTLLSRNEDDGSKEAVRTHVSCYKTLREAPEVAVLVRSSAMVMRLETEAGTIGITELDAVRSANGAFKALALDGVAPSPDSVRSGKYKVVKEYAFVTRGQPQGVAKRFLDFVASAEGRDVLAANGIVTTR